MQYVGAALFLVLIGIIMREMRHGIATLLGFAAWTALWVWVGRSFALVLKALLS